MAKLPINIVGDKILRQKAKKVTTTDDSTVEFIKDMFDTLHASDGVGLAANQVGSRDAILIADLSHVEGYEETDPIVVINPKIIKSEGNSTYEEGCLSLPGIKLEITRPEKVLLRYQDTDLNTHEENFSGLFARVIQHEIDHLNGKLIIDYLEEEALKNLEPELQKLKAREIEVPYSVSVHEAF